MIISVDHNNKFDVSYYTCMYFTHELLSADMLQQALPVEIDGCNRVHEATNNYYLVFISLFSLSDIRIVIIQCTSTDGHYIGLSSGFIFPLSLLDIIIDKVHVHIFLGSHYHHNFRENMRFGETTLVHELNTAHNQNNEYYIC